MAGSRLTILLCIIGVAAAVGVAAWFYQASGKDTQPDVATMDEEGRG